MTEDQIKILLLPPLCGSVERALGFWPAKQPSAGRQQTTLLLYVLYTIPSKSKMWKHQLCASRQVDTKQDIKFFFNIIVHHLHNKRYGKTFFFEIFFIGFRNKCQWGLIHSDLDWKRDVSSIFLTILSVLEMNYYRDKNDDFILRNILWVIDLFLQIYCEPQFESPTKLFLNEVFECTIDFEFGARKSFGRKIYAQTPIFE